jgi:hypothetical protein
MGVIATEGLDVEEIRVLDWTIGNFERLGCDHMQAIELATAGADYRLLARLLAQGCKLELALRIVG